MASAWRASNLALCFMLFSITGFVQGKSNRQEKRQRQRDSERERERSVLFNDAVNC